MALSWSWNSKSFNTSYVKMKSILYVIYTYGGNGGHYRSLLTTAGVLRDYVNVFILNIGKQVSPIIESSSLPHDFMFFDKRNWNEVSTKIKAFVKDNRIDIIHTYDHISYCAVYSVSNQLGVPIVLTKCGGPIVKYKLICPPCENLVVFSSEDDEYFEKHEHVPHKILIPNRVTQFESDYKRIEAIITENNLKNKKIILRIGRISETYMKTIKQSINLVEVLHDFDDSYVLLLVGAIDDNNSYNKLKEIIGNIDYVYTETTPERVKDAKVIIEMSTCVIGTGRGFMEACSKNKIMFAPVANSNFPAPVTNSNIESIARFNFSERYCVEDVVKPEDLINHARSEPDSIKWFYDYFDINAATGKYLKFYDTLLNTHNYSKFRVFVAKKIFSVSTWSIIKPFYKYLFDK